MSELKPTTKEERDSWKTETLLNIDRVHRLIADVERLEKKVEKHKKYREIAEAEVERLKTDQSANHFNGLPHPPSCACSSCVGYPGRP